MTEENKSKKRPVRFPDTMYKPQPKQRKSHIEDICKQCGQDFLDWLEKGCKRKECDNYTG